jgi:hypothetical protein
MDHPFYGDHSSIMAALKDTGAPRALSQQFVFIELYLSSLFLLYARVLGRIL